MIKAGKLSTSGAKEHSQYDSALQQPGRGLRIGRPETDDRKRGEEERRPHWKLGLRSLLAEAHALDAASLGKYASPAHRSLRALVDRGAVAVGTGGKAARVWESEGAGRKGEDGDDGDLHRDGGRGC